MNKAHERQLLLEVRNVADQDHDCPDIVDGSKRTLLPRLHKTGEARSACYAPSDILSRAKGHLSHKKVECLWSFINPFRQHYGYGKTDFNSIKHDGKIRWAKIRKKYMLEDVQ